MVVILELSAFVRARGALLCHGPCYTRTAVNSFDLAESSSSVKMKPKPKQFHPVFSSFWGGEFDVPTS